MAFFSIYVGSILICFHNGYSVCIILCIPCRPLCCVVTVCENLSVSIHIATAKRKCSINDYIKSEYLFIKGMNENAEYTLREICFRVPFFTKCPRFLGENGNVLFFKNFTNKLTDFWDNLYTLYYKISCEDMNCKELDQYSVKFRGFVRTWLMFQFHDNFSPNYHMLKGNPIPWSYYNSHIKSDVLHGDA
jgi:hypothetical protein